MGVDEKRRSPDIARAVEHEQGAIAVSLDLDHFQAEFTLAFLPPLIAQYHGQACGEIAEAFLAFAGFGCDLEPGFLGTVGRATDRGFDRPGRNGKNDPGQGKHWVGESEAHHRFLLSAAIRRAGKSGNRRRGPDGGRAISSPSALARTFAHMVEQFLPGA